MPWLWRKVALLDEIEPGGGVRAELDGEPIVVLRTTEGVRVLGARCPHQGGLLGTELVDGRTAVCPSHGWAFDAASGRHLLFRGVGVPVYAARLRGDAVFVRGSLRRALGRALRRLAGRGDAPMRSGGPE